MDEDTDDPPPPPPSPPSLATGRDASGSGTDGTSSAGSASPEDSAGQAPEDLGGSPAASAPRARQAGIQTGTSVTVQASSLPSRLAVLGGTLDRGRVEPIADQAVEESIGELVPDRQVARDGDKAPAASLGSMIGGAAQWGSRVSSCASVQLSGSGQDAAPGDPRRGNSPPSVCLLWWMATGRSSDKAVDQGEDCVDRIRAPPSQVLVGSVGIFPEARMGPVGSGPTVDDLHGLAASASIGGDQINLPSPVLRGFRLEYCVTPTRGGGWVVPG